MKRKLTNAAVLSLAIMLGLATVGFALHYNFDITLVNPSKIYIVQIIAVALVLCSVVPIILMHRFIASKRLLKKSYVRFSFYRLFFPSVTVGFALSSYFLTSIESFLYIALMGLVLLFFVWPTRDRVQLELDELEKGKGENA